MSHRRAVLLVFVASAAVLVTEIVAGRLMAPYVGVSLETFTGIIGTILGGIAAGAAAGGRLADMRDPRPVIPMLFLVGGGLVWLSLPITTALGPQVGEGPAAIVGLTVAAFLAPAAVLSAVPPMVAKLRLGDLDDTGSVVGGLSAASTVGALAGTFVTGFVLIAYVPSRATIVGTGAVLVAIGAVGSIGRLRSAPVPAVLLAGALLLGVTDDLPCEFETRYYCARIEVDPDDEGSRILVLDDLRHSHVDLDDPTTLRFRYVRLLAGAIEELPPGAIDALHVGGGGFTLPRYIAAVRPGSRSTVLEIDPDLADIARDHLGLVTGPDLVVDTGDARLSITDLPDASFDVVVGDAFGGRSVPWHLTTREFVAEVDRVLRPGGIYVMNVVDGGSADFARAQTATLDDVLGSSLAVVPTDGIPAARGTNIVLVAGRAPSIGEPADSDGRLLAGAELDEFVGDAMVLTDDHAPVDRLTRW